LRKQRPPSPPVPARSAPRRAPGTIGRADTLASVEGAPVRPARGIPTTSEVVMLNWAIVFLIVALIAGVLGFGGISATAAGIAKILFFIFLVLFLVSLIARLVQGRRTPPL
jgi:uncharacterized membrane protein YtjA (UPF0391 family)